MTNFSTTLLFLQLVSHIIAALTILFLGIVVYFHDRKSFANIILFINTLVATLWAISNYFSLTIPPPEVLFWIRLVIFFAVFHIFSFFLFIYIFPRREVKIKFLHTFLFVILLISISTISLSPYGFK